MIRTNRIARSFALLAFALAPVARAQTRPAAPPAAPPATNAAAPTPDFSQGFAALHRLGVTNVCRATFVSFAGNEPYAMYATSLPYQLMTMQRFGWQLSGDASNGVFLLGDGLTVRRATASAPKQTPEQRYRNWQGADEDAEFVAATQTVEGVTWKAADLDAQIRQIAGKLQKEVARRDAELAKAGESGEAMSQRLVRMSSMGGQSLAPVLFFAAHAADQARTNEANQLVALGMNLAGNRARLLEDAVNRLADTAYNEAWRRFCGSGDWIAYGRDVEAVTVRFPRGWRNATNTVELARRLRAFTAAGLKPAPLPGDLSAADRALADALVAAPRGREVAWTLQQPGFWVLPRDTNDVTGAWIATNAHPLARLVRGGTNAIPLLLALLDDRTTLTTLVCARPLVDAVPEDTDEMEMMMMRHESMMPGMPGAFRHPASRADIAAILLEAFVGQSQDPYRYVRGRPVQEAPKTLAERVRDWQAAYAGLGTEDLAARLLVSKDYNASRQAADYMARSSSTSAWQRLEQHILRERNPDALSDVAEKYVRRRGRQAVPFVEAFAKRLTGPVAPAGEAPENVDPQLFKNASSSDQYDKYRQKRAKQVVARLRRMAENKPVTAVLDEIAADKLTFADTRAELQDLWKLTPQEALNAVVESAARATNGATRGSLLAAANWIPSMARYRTPVRPGADDADGADAKPLMLSALPAAAAWRQLLADTRVPANATPTPWIPEPTMRLHAAIMMEKMCSPGATNDVATLVSRLGPPAHELLLQRAASRLSGAAEVQPPLPDAGRVPAARLLALTNAVPSAAALAALTPDERLALCLAVQENPALARGLAAGAHRLRVVAPPAELSAAGAALKAGDGQPLSATFLQSLAAQSEAFAKQGRRVTYELRRLPGFAGVEAVVRPSRPDDTPPASGGGVAVYVTACDGPNERLVCHPGAAPAKPAAAENPLQRPTDDDLLAAEAARIERGPLSAAEAEAAFWKRIDAFCAGDNSLGFPAIVNVAAVPIAK